METVVIIPARYASTRYPGKPLVALRGTTGERKTLIERSWIAAKSAAGVDAVYVATDDDRIADAARGFGAEVVMTSTNCENGTARCADAIERLGISPKIIVNLQGDAPLTPAWFVEALVAEMRANPDVEVTTPILRCSGSHRAALIADRAAGRVGGTTAVRAANNDALYFSKEVIPFSASSYADDAPTPVFHHVGVYGYTVAALAAYRAAPARSLEMLEGLEQLRFLENNIAVRCVEVDGKGRAFWELNNPEDVEKIERHFAEIGIE